MTNQQLRQFVLVVVIACQALTGIVATADPVMRAVEMMHCDSVAMAMNITDSSLQAGEHHMASAEEVASTNVGNDAEHACDKGCCCPGVCSGAAALLPQTVTLLDAGAVTVLVLINSPYAEQRAASRLRPPIIA